MNSIDYMPLNSMVYVTLSLLYWLPIVYPIAIYSYPYQGLQTSLKNVKNLSLRNRLVWRIFTSKNQKIIKISSKKRPKNPPKKSERFCEIFLKFRNFAKSGGLAENFGRSGRAHCCFRGHFYRFSPVFGVNLLLKGFVPKNLKISKNQVFWPPEAKF